MQRWASIAAACLFLIAIAGCTAAGTAERSADDAALDRLVDGLGPSPYQEDGQLSPDGRRIRDIVELQGSLLRYRLDQGRFPDQLAELLPDHAPASGRIPQDPVSGEPYAYNVTDSGTDYRIAATLSNGNTFPGVAHMPVEPE